MNEMLAMLDVLPADAVPSQCLIIAEFLAQRGDPEAEGWMALGRLGKVPERFHDAELNIWHHWFWAEKSGHDFMTKPENRLSPSWFMAMGGIRGASTSRSAALHAAAAAFVGLSLGMKRDIVRVSSHDGSMCHVS